MACAAVQGYGAYLAVLYAMVALLMGNVGLCIWVAWCFKEQKFPVIWPIKVLRVFSSVFFQAFDVASLNLLQVSHSSLFTQLLLTGGGWTGRLIRCLRQRGEFQTVSQHGMCDAPRIHTLTLMGKGIAAC